MALSNLISALSHQVERRPLPKTPRAPSVQYEDDPDDQMAQQLGYAEGQSFAIEYVNSKGEASLRRITVFSLVQNSSGVPALMARCHERNATRQFRVDRIKSCIDYDGEVCEDVALFLHENFGMAHQMASRREATDDLARWPEIREVVRPDAIVLVALSRADGLVLKSEIDIAVTYLALLAERGDMHLTTPEISCLETMVRRLRPGPPTIELGLNALSDASPKRIRSLLMTAVEVIDADGFRHPEEIKLVNTLAREMIGVDLVS